MCTIALAKVQRNYNCYNVYFYECLRCEGINSFVQMTSRCQSLMYREIDFFNDSLIYLIYIRKQLKQGVPVN